MPPTGLSTTRTAAGSSRAVNRRRSGSAVQTYNGSTSQKIYVLDRHTGALLWNADAQYGFFNNSVVAGNGKLFAMDRLNWKEPYQNLTDAFNVRKRGSNDGYDNSFKKANLLAFDLATGPQLWKKTQADAQLFGTWLAYSEQYDILLECTRGASDYYERPARTNKKMAAWKGADGTILWSQLNQGYYGGPVMLNGDMIVTQSSNDMNAINLLTGIPIRSPVCHLGRASRERRLPLRHVGDRKDNSGIFWMEYPFGELAGGYSYQIPVGIAVKGQHHVLPAPQLDSVGRYALGGGGRRGRHSKITVTMVAERQGLGGQGGAGCFPGARL